LIRVALAGVVYVAPVPLVRTVRVGCLPGDSAFLPKNAHRTTPDDSPTKSAVSPTAVVMLTPPGRMSDAPLVRVRMPENSTILTRPLASVIPVIGVVPVIC